jgi:hypothetical protein
MNNEYLNTLIDNSGDAFIFGKNETAPQSVFLFQAADSRPAENKNYVKIFHGNELAVRNNFPIERNNVAPDWLFPIIILMLAFFAWMKVFYSKYFIQMIKAFFNLNLSNQIVRDENIFIQRISIYLSIVFNLIAALLIYLISIHYGWHLGGLEPGFTRYLLFVLFVTLTYALKYLILKICGWLFEQEKEIATYIFNIFLINNILGMALLPFVCLLAYNSSSIGSGFIVIPIILVCGAFLWRLVKGIRIGLGTGSFSPLYLFLYLCTLEIAPLMIFIRIIVQ